MYREEYETREKCDTDSGSKIYIPSEQHGNCVPKTGQSARLISLLDVLQINKFGDLHGLSLKSLAGYRNCGRRTMEALSSLVHSVKGHIGEPAVSSDFSVSAKPFSLEQTAEVLASLDSATVELSDRSRKLMQVLWTNSAKPKAMTKIASEQHLSKQRIHYLKVRALAQIKTDVGPRLDAYLQLVSDYCSEKVCPLTPELLKHWMGHTEIKLQRELPAYVWLLGALTPKIPAWPLGQQSSGSDEVIPIVTAIKAQLHRSRTGLALKKVFHASGLRKQKIQPHQFLKALKHSRSLVVDISATGMGTVRLRHIRFYRNRSDSK